MDPTIDCQELYALLGDDELVVVDCRPEDTWDRLPFHIPGALRMPLVDLYRSSSVLPEDELVVLCGSDPDGADAQRACRMLRLRGREAVWLRGGIHAWTSAGLPTEQHAAATLRRAGAMPAAR